MKHYGIPAILNSAAWDVLDRFMADSRIGFVEEPAGVETCWRRLTGRNTASPKMWMDAYLASVAIAGKFQLVTTDRGFLQYGGLDVVVIGE